ATGQQGPHGATSLEANVNDHKGQEVHNENNQAESADAFPRALHNARILFCAAGTLAGTGVTAFSHFESNGRGIEYESPTLTLEGSDFGSSPTVSIGVAGGSYQPLQIISANSNKIVAALNSIQPGTYTVMVTIGSG